MWYRNRDMLDSADHLTIASIDNFVRIAHQWLPDHATPLLIARPPNNSSRLDQEWQRILKWTSLGCLRPWTWLVAWDLDHIILDLTDDMIGVSDFVTCLEAYGFKDMDLTLVMVTRTCNLTWDLALKTWDLTWTQNLVTWLQICCMVPDCIYNMVV